MKNIILHFDEETKSESVTFFLIKHSLTTQTICSAGTEFAPIPVAKSIMSTDSDCSAED